MKITPTKIAGVMLAETERFDDERGTFMRIYCNETLNAAGLSHHAPMQMNLSVTHKRGALRGMHYQTEKGLEGKIVRCLHGRILDVIVDVRKNSPTFLQHVAVKLSDDNMAVIIPPGCAHGFQLLTEKCEMVYTHSSIYAPDHQAGIRYDDPRLGIKWPMPITVISERDRTLPWLSADFQGVGNAL